MTWARFNHLAETYRLLRGASVTARHVGVLAELAVWRQARALRWVALTSKGLRIGVSDDVPGSKFPRTLPSPSGEEVPVRLERSPADAPIVQAGITGTLRNTTRDGLPGSLGALATDATGTRRFAVTAAHVVAGSASACAKDDVYIDCSARRFRGSLSSWEPALGRAVMRTRIDASIIELSDTEFAALSSLVDLPTGLDRAVLAGTRLSLRRAGQSPLSGAFRGWWSGWINARLSFDGRDYWLDDAMAIAYDPPFSQGGDSGAGVWDTDDKLVGFHCAGMQTESGWNALACEAEDVFNYFGIRLVTRDGLVSTGSSHAYEAAASLARSAQRAPDPQQLPTAGPLDGSAEVDTLARTLWGEARGEREVERSMRAVAAVVLNRRKRQTYWGKSIVEVCRKPWQFSCWNRNDPNLPLIMNVTAKDRIFAQALAIAAEAAGPDTFSDETIGATHYYSTSMANPPSWARGHTPSKTIGRHLFFNNIP